ncbi:MAG: Na+/H+ antiporter NhaA [Ilumatobacteraceae bacterium]
MPRSPYNPANFLERFVAVEVRAAALVVVAAIAGVLSATIGDLAINNDVSNFISDVAIGGFFLLVGLELRREIANGTLSGQVLRIATIAAGAGMIGPALIFISFAPSGARDGWVAVVATDIALATAITTLGRFRPVLRTMLLTIAVLDDIGGIAALATTGKSPKMLWMLAVVVAVILFAWSIRTFNFGVIYTIAACALTVVLILRAGLHPSLGAFAIGMAVPRLDTDNPSVAEMVEESIHPWIAAVLLPIFVFLHTLVPLRIPDYAPASLVVVTGLAILVGKTIGIGGTLLMFRRRFEIHASEALAVGLAAAAAMTVALIGVVASIHGTKYVEVVSLGVLAATTIAFILGIVAGRLRRDSFR